MSVEHLSLVFVTFILGGILKGATGVGAPLIAIPVMALLIDVPFAVAVFLVPNIMSNVWQTWKYRTSIPKGRFPFYFAATGMMGAVVGTLVLAEFSSVALTTTVAIVVLLYVAFKLKNPGWKLEREAADKLVIPMGIIGGFLQGATGLSAPVSVTFMNAVRMSRPEFIFTMSLFFFSMTLVQFPGQFILGIMTLERFVYGLIAVAPLFIGMTIGSLLGKRISKSTFDLIIISVLTLLAVRMLTANFL